MRGRPTAFPGEATTRRNVRLPKRIWAIADALASRLGTTPAGAIAWAVGEKEAEEEVKSDVIVTHFAGSDEHGGRWAGTKLKTFAMCGAGGRGKLVRVTLTPALVSCPACKARVRGPLAP